MGSAAFLATLKTVLSQWGAPEETAPLRSRFGLGGLNPPQLSRTPGRKPARWFALPKGVVGRTLPAVILIIDNYDSFTYNLVQMVGALRLDREIRVVRNDAVTVDEVLSWKPEHVIISPGPGAPDDAGISVDLVKRLGGEVPILGVCLGHQCIGAAFGARIVRAPRLMHGKTSRVNHDGIGVYAALPNPFTATRYHSLTIDPTTIPDGFIITSRTDRAELMGIRHRTMPIEGVQFHPESFLTEVGPRLIANFLGA